MKKLSARTRKSLETRCAKIRKARDAAAAVVNKKIGKLGDLEQKAVRAVQKRFDKRTRPLMRRRDQIMAKANKKLRPLERKLGG
jgi:hypothetical protein